MKNICIIPTQHFDIIWRKSHEYYRQVRERAIKQALYLLEKYDDYRFTLDQAEVIKEFIDHNPDYKDKLQKVFDSGRLEICGGGWTLIDSNMVYGESIIRNLMYGRQWFRENYGLNIKGNSLVDTFGMCHQLPQIMQLFGDSYFITGRTPGAKGKFLNKNHGPFIWQGIDGSRIIGSESATTEEDINGFYENTGIVLDEDIHITDDNFHEVKQSMEEGIQKLINLPYDVTYIEYTGEEHTPSEALPLLVEKYKGKDYNLAMYTPDEFYNKISKDNVPVIKGEFNPIFTGCYTTRIDLKLRTRRCENALLAAEKIVAMVELKGKKINNIQWGEIWRQLHYVQFHDAICGCHIDISYEPLLEKLEHVSQKAQEITEKALEVIGETDQSKMSVFNTLEFKRKDRVTIKDAKDIMIKDYNGDRIPSYDDSEGTHFICEVPPMGYRTFMIETSQDKSNVKEISSNRIETKRYIVEVKKDRLVITDKVLNTRLDSDDIGMGHIIYGQDTGNLWIERKTGKYVSEKVGEIELVEAVENPLSFTITYRGRISKDNLKDQSWDGADYLEWEKQYIFYKDLEYIDLNVTLNWKGKDSTVIMQYPCEFVSKDGDAYYETPFGLEKRNPYVPSYEDYTGGTWPALDSADFSDDERGLTIANDGTPAYKIEDNRIEVTMLRSGTDWSIPCFPFEPEEGSYDAGKHKYAIRIIPHKGNYLEACGYKSGRGFNQKMIVSNHKYYGKEMESNLEIKEDNIVLSAFKMSEDKKAYTLRLYETIGKETTANIIINADVKKVVEVNAQETEEIGAIDLLQLRLKPYEIKTIKIMV